MNFMSHGLLTIYKNFRFPVYIVGHPVYDGPNDQAKEVVMTLVLFEDRGDGLEAVTVVEAMGDALVDEYGYMMTILALADHNRAAVGLYDFDVTAAVFGAPALMGVIGGR